MTTNEQKHDMDRRDFITSVFGAALASSVLGVSTWGAGCKPSVVGLTMHMALEADTPVLQLSLPSSEGPEGLFALGQQLAPLRDEGVFILVSGNIVHNLRQWRRDGASTPGWAERVGRRRRISGGGVRVRQYQSTMRAVRVSPQRLKVR